jgi:transcriptional regulator with XRE-family HTH domain
MVETGKRKTPAAETVHALASLYGTTVEYLLTGEGEEPTKESVVAAVGAKQGAAPEAEATFPEGDSRVA